MNDQHQFDPERVEIQRLIDKVCDQLESDWASGIAPDIPMIIQRFDPDAIPGLLSEIMKSDEEINELNQSELRQKYNAMLPEYSHFVDAILRSMFNDQNSTEDDENTVRGIAGPKMNLNHDLIGEKIGDYLIIEKIGEGTFGVVYLARDTILGRNIVIKIPRSPGFFSQSDIDFFLDEARNSCFLHHEYILRVLHVGMHKGLPYIVQDYFEGGDLRQTLANNSYSIEATVDFIRKVAEAIGYAHQFRIIHRDLKPANILIKTNGDPVVADFGLALRDPHLSGREGEVAGTIQYMSPEQVRGESHRLDGRSDVWAIGVILYLMLVGRLPFEGEGIDQVRDAILFGRPTPPRQLNDKISKELNRICLKCLALRVNDRYLTALDLADDLKDVINETAVSNRQIASEEAGGSSEPAVAVVPKGLMAFDKSDSDFFLELLPGPMDREGIPECIHFWKNRIEDPARSHPIGLIYGPSGCGKSSLVSAGLLPRLADDILVVHVESTPDDTEIRLFKGLRASIPSIPEDPSLPEVIAGIRRGQWLPRDKRLLIVFDQFEQWLHANTIDEHSQLIDALRHCDGRIVQALILVRDDFWMGISRFFRQLEIELVERQNFASVDLFSKRHAKDVLIKFGQAYGTLPKNGSEINESQQRFLDQAIDMIAKNESVICVRSVLFAETVKNQTWEVDTLRKIGDSKNIGIVFLEQVLGEGATNPKYRFHRKALLAILESLLPNEGVEIKGNLRSRKELAQAAQIDANDPDFDTALNILDSELRLITPTEPDTGRQVSASDPAGGPESDESVTVSSRSWYQLTHDYLVPSLRAWMQSVRGRTRRGRAKLRLQALASQWQSSGQTRYLPSFLEYCSVVWNVPRREWNTDERRLLKLSTVHFGLRASALVIFGLFLAALTWWITNDPTSDLVDRIVDAKSGRVVEDAEQLKRDHDYAIKLLRNKLDDASAEQERQILTVLGMLSDLKRKETEFLIDSLSIFTPNEYSNLIAALQRQKDQSLAEIDRKLEETIDDVGWSRLLVLRLFLEPSTVFPAFKFEKDPTRRTTLVHTIKDWHGDLDQAKQLLDAAIISDMESAISGLCVAFGRIDKDEFSDSVFDDLAKQIHLLHQTDERASVHGSSQWALTNWGESIAVPKISAKKGWEWWVNDQEMTMVNVKGGKVTVVEPNDPNAEPRSLNVDDFSISVCEVTGLLFNKFLADKDPKVEKPNRVPQTISATSIGNVSVEDQILFCNWLSKREGHTECFERSKRQVKIRDLNANEKLVDEWVLNVDSDGYRLPFSKELQLAAKGGVKNGCSTAYYFADTATATVLFGDYMWCFSNSQTNGSPTVQIPAQKIPNQIGLFDVLGNLGEYCIIASTDDPKRILDKRNSVEYRTLGYLSGVAQNGINISIPRYQDRREPAVGFRVVKQNIEFPTQDNKNPAQD